MNSIYQLKPTIIGGGIGGLTMANALQKAGIDFELYEQAPELTEVGAGIGLTKGVLKLMDMLDLEDEIKANSFHIKHLYLTDKQLNIRRKLPADSPGVCIHRAVLIDILKSKLPKSKIHLSKRVSDIQSYPDYAKIHFDSGASITSPLIIAADGIHSAVRRSIFPDISIRYINQTIWRGITTVENPGILKDAYIEVWDEGLRFLTIPYNSKEMFWLAVKPAPPGSVDNPDEVKNELLGLFQNFHPTFKNLIQHSGKIIRNDMNDLGSPNRPWHHNRIVFIGDSIHATTPNLAQGGCQAIEDAVCLSFCLKAYPSNPEQAFQKYQDLRQNKVSFIVNNSWKFGVAAHSRNPLKHYLYRALLEYAPAFFLERQEKYLNNIDYLRKF